MATDEIVLPEVRPDTPRRRRLPVPRDPKTLAIVILLALVIAEAFLFVRKDTDGGRTEVLQLSQRFMTLLTTYNADTLAKQSADILKLSTSQFRSEYQTVTGGEFPARLRETEADSKGRILRIAVTDLEGDDATVLGLVEVTTKNKATPTPKAVENLIELTLVRTSGGWRVTSVLIHGEVG